MGEETLRRLKGAAYETNSHCYTAVVNIADLKALIEDWERLNKALTDQALDELR